jgi:hypothetical protein
MSGSLIEDLLENYGQLRTTCIHLVMLARTVHFEATAGMRERSKTAMSLAEPP